MREVSAGVFLNSTHTDTLDRFYCYLHLPTIFINIVDYTSQNINKLVVSQMSHLSRAVTENDGMVVVDVLIKHVSTP